MTHRTCRECGETLPRDRFEGNRLQCKPCRSKVRCEEDREDRLIKNTPKPWSLIREAYELSKRDASVVARAVKRYGQLDPCPDDIIRAYTTDWRRQVELVTCVAYRRRVS